MADGDDARCLLCRRQLRSNAAYIVRQTLLQAGYISLIRESRVYFHMARNYQTRKIVKYQS